VLGTASEKSMAMLAQETEIHGIAGPIDQC
jgi:hypothetical protein